MPTRVEPRAFVNFSVRLDLASNERRRRQAEESLICVRCPLVGEKRQRRTPNGLLWDCDQANPVRKARGCRTGMRIALQVGAKATHTAVMLPP
jgi:hypothetical protein